MIVELKITAVEDTLFWVGQGCVLLFGNARVVETSQVLGNCENGKQMWVTPTQADLSQKHTSDL